MIGYPLNKEKFTLTFTKVIFKNIAEPTSAYITSKCVVADVITQKFILGTLVQILAMQLLIMHNDVFAWNSYQNTLTHLQ
jgi:hypothetical protein